MDPETIVARKRTFRSRMKVILNDEERFQDVEEFTYEQSHSSEEGGPDLSKSGAAASMHVDSEWEVNNVKSTDLGDDIKSLVGQLTNGYK